jgi:hypothetical protein
MLAAGILGDCSGHRGGFSTIPLGEALRKWDWLRVGTAKILEKSLVAKVSVPISFTALGFVGSRIRENSDFPLAGSASRSPFTRSEALAMKLSSIIAAYAGIFLGACAAVAQTDEFRIDTDVFVGENKEPIAQSVTVFSSGMVYDFPLIGPREITVFDPGRGRFVLLDADRKVKTTLSTQDLLEFTAAMKVQAEKMGGLLAGASDAQFERETDSAGEWLTVRTKLLTYRAKGIEPRIVSAAASYQQFADWYARLNATRPGSMPPFARIELNRMLVEKSLIPEEVELTVAPERGLMGRKTTIHSRHLPYWRLSNTDRSRIEAAGTQMAKFPAVSFQEYRQTPRP